MSNKLLKLLPLALLTVSTVAFADTSASKVVSQASHAVSQAKQAVANTASEVKTAVVNKAKEVASSKVAEKAAAAKTAVADKAKEVTSAVADKAKEVKSAVEEKAEGLTHTSSEVRSSSSNVVPVQAHQAVSTDKLKFTKPIALKKQLVTYAVKACANVDGKSAKDAPCNEYNYKSFVTNLPWLNDMVSEGSYFSTKAVNGKAANVAEQKKAALADLKAKLESELKTNKNYLGSETDITNKLTGQYGNLVAIETSKYQANSMMAHGETTTDRYVVDLATHNKVGLYDLFTKSQAEMVPVLNKLTATQMCHMLDAKVKQNKGQSLDNGVVDGINLDGVYKDAHGKAMPCVDYQLNSAKAAEGYKTPTNYEFTKQGVKFHYGELFSHADGDVSVTVPYKELQSYLKPYYAAQLAKFAHLKIKK